MDAHQLKAVEDELQKLDVIVKAAEDWSSVYGKDKKSHAKLIDNEAEMTRTLREMFRGIAKDAPDAVNWKQYDKELTAVKASRRVMAAINVNTIVSDDFLNGVNSEFVKVSLKYIATAVATGIAGGESINKIYLNVPTANDLISQLTTERLAFLVGKTINNEGKAVNNPNATYRVSDTTRDQIASSIKTSIGLGEDRNDASKRITDILSDPARAETIAQTESVNAYGAGLHGYGKSSGATGKEWQDVGATDECADYADMGAVDLDYEYEPGVLYPAAHPNCRCGSRLLYANEYTPDDGGGDNAE